MTSDKIQFVTSVSDAATVNLSLSSEPWRVLFAGTDASPPPMRRVIVDTLLRDGEFVSQTAYSNRTVTLHLQLRAVDPPTAAAQLQLLNRELDKPRNVLRWQPDPALPAVYFRTLRASDYTQAVDHGLNTYDFTVQLDADPFAIGSRIDLSPATINNDPAAGSNGKFCEFSNIRGDVEAPLLIKLTGSTTVGKQSAFGLRRRGTPSQAPLVLQAEAMTQGTNTATSANNTRYSGSSNNFSTTSFGTNSMVTRLSTTLFPGSASIDVRGTYRVFARVNSTVAGDTFEMQLTHGARGVVNPANDIVSSSTTSPNMVDLGLIQMPEGFDPVFDGGSGAALQVAGVALSVQAFRTSGSGNLLWDYFLFVPADDTLALVTWGTTGPTTMVMDGYSRSIYGLNSSGQLADITGTAVEGDFLALSPGVINRLVFINDVTPDNTTEDTNSGTQTLTCSYWPQYLYVAGPTS